MKTFTSYRSAARAVGVSAPVIRSWVKSGKIDAGPWTLQTLRRVQASNHPGGMPATLAEHGTLSRYRVGCPCRDCLDVHNTECRETRRAARWALVGPVWPLILADLADGVRVGDAAAAHGLTGSQVWGVASADPNRLAELDDALNRGRRPDLAHGRYPTARTCQCRECRDKKHGPRAAPATRQRSPNSARATVSR